MSHKQERAVLITTSHRGVFFGFTTQTTREIVESKIADLRAARNCIRWPEEQKGFIGLADKGPLAGSRIGPPADIAINDVTSAAYCTDAAVVAWEKSPWTR